MNRPRSTNNSLAAEAFLAPGSSSQLGPQAPLPQSSVASVPSSAPVPVDEIAAAVAQAIGSVLPGMLSSIQSTSTAISSSSPSASAVSVSLHHSDLRVPEHPRISVGPPFSSPSTSSVASSGRLALPSLVNTFTPVPAISSICSPALLGPVSSSLAVQTSPTFVPTTALPVSVPPVREIAFIVGPGHAPIPHKLVLKITCGHFVDLADLLSANLRAGDNQPQTFLEGKLVMSAPKCRVADVSDILTWTEAFSIYQMVLCHYHPNRWEDLSRYKLLIIQTARQYPGPAWLDYDLAFRKDAAASGLTDWSKMNLDLYNFHLRTPQAPSTRQMIQTSATTSSAGDGDPTPPARYCHSWNEGKCRWSLG